MACDLDNSFEVRLSTLADEAAVSSLLASSYSALMAASYAPSVLATVLPIITVARPELLSSGSYFVTASMPATGEPEIIGCGGWTPERPGSAAVEARIGHVRHYATDPRWTRRGVGRAIMDAIVQSARNRGIRRLEVYSSLNAADFYQAVGFQTCELKSVALAGTVQFESVVMRRSLV